MNSAKRRSTTLALALTASLVGVLALPVARAQAADSDMPRAGGRRAFLGVRMQELTDDLRDSYDYRGAGVLVAGVTEDSPADKLGIQDGDIITKIDDMPVNGPDQLARRVGSRSPGALVSVRVWRDGKEIALGRIALGSQDDRMGDRTYDRSGGRAEDRSDDDGDRRVIIRRGPRAPEAPEAPEAPDAPAPPPPPDGPRHMHNHDGEDVHGDDDMGDLPQLQGLRGLSDMGRGNAPLAMMFGRGRLGVELSDLDSDLGSYFRGDAGHGVLVTRVLEDTPADKAGLKAGDVITEFDGQPVSSADDLRRLVQQQGAGDVDVRVRRHGDARNFTARLGERGNMSFRGLPGGRGMAGWMDDKDGSGDKGKADKRVYRYRINGGGDVWGNGNDKLSPEDRAQLKKDLDQLRKDMRQMHQQMHQDMRRGDDDSRDEGKDDDRKNGKDDDDDDDDSGN